MIQPKSSRMINPTMLAEFHWLCRAMMLANRAPVHKANDQKNDITRTQLVTKMSKPCRNDRKAMNGEMAE